MAHSDNIPTPRKNLTGKIFGFLTVEKLTGKATNKGPIWQCRCICGALVERASSRLQEGTKSNCGCKRPELSRTHGFSPGGKRTPEYISWRGMKRRCLLPNDPGYHHYGGRGIQICERLITFEGFLQTLGSKPEPTYHVDRRDNNKHYSCGQCEQCTVNGWEMNVRWVTAKQNSRNKRDNRIVEYRGERKVLAVWVEELGLKRYRVTNRLRAGWSIEKTFETPKLK